MNADTRQKMIADIQSARARLKVLRDAAGDLVRHGPHSHEDGEDVRGGRATPRCPHARAGGECDYVERVAEKIAEYDAVARYLPAADREAGHRGIRADELKAWMAEMAPARSTLLHAEAMERPEFERLVPEFEAPDSPTEVYAAAVTDRGSPDTPLLLGLLEAIERERIAKRVDQMTAPEAKAAWATVTAPLNGAAPGEIVGRQVLLRELRRHKHGWKGKRFNPATDQVSATAAKELSEAIRAHDEARVPVELRQALDECAEIRRSMALIGRAFKLRDLSASELDKLTEEQGS